MSDPLIRRAVASVAVGGALAFALSGCGSSSSATTHPQTQTELTPAQQAAKERAAVAVKYAALVKLLNHAGDLFNANKSSATLANYMDALQVFDNHILRIGATGQAAADIRDLVRVNSQTIGAAKNADYSSLNSYETQAAAASNIVRADLGLPPPPK
jgi:hypothetical protein